RRSLRGRQISRLVSCVRPLFFGHDLCPDRLSLPVQPIPGGWSWDRTAARWRCTRPHHAPASWTRWRHTAYDRLRPVSCTGASSSVRFSVVARPCCAPIRCCAPIQGLDIIISYSLKIRKLFSSRSLPASPHVQVLTITGIGEATAAALVAKIVDINRFATPNHLVSYFGVFPEESSSGVDKRGRPLPPGTLIMSPKGNDLVRFYLWNAARN